jgi:hypothetical protein
MRRNYGRLAASVVALLVVAISIVVPASAASASCSVSVASHYQFGSGNGYTTFIISKPVGIQTGGMNFDAANFSLDLANDTVVQQFGQTSSAIYEGVAWNDFGGYSGDQGGYFYVTYC